MWKLLRGNKQPGQVVQARQRRRLGFDVLESRVVPTTWRVTNLSTTSSTVGSLSWAIAQANQDRTNTSAIINIDSALSGLSIPVTGTLNFNNTTETIQINGPTGGVYLTGGGTGSPFSIFQIAANNTVVLNSLVFRNGAASQGSAINNLGTLTLQSCAFINNQAVSGGTTATNGYNGALYNGGVVTAVNCYFSGNSASNTTDSAFFYGMGGAVCNTGTMTISTCTFTNNAAGSKNGGAGGAIYSSGTLSIADSVFTSNATNDGGGALINYQGTLTVANTTFSKNAAPNGGGALLSYGGTSTLANVTMSGNVANTNGAGLGGAIYNYSGPLTLTNCTVARNTGLTGGGLYNDSGTILLQNTIVVLNTANTSADIGGTNVSALSSYNMIGAASGGLVGAVNGNIVGVTSPGLAVLGSYGGVGQTIALLPGSPAIDRGNNNRTDGDIDQRGLDRIVNGTVDIGAFESQGFTFSITGNDQSTWVNSSFALPLVVTVTANNPVEPVNLGTITFTAPILGASAVLSAPGNITSGKVSITAKANASAGSYTVSAAARGAESVDFSLTNNPIPALGPLSNTGWTVNQTGYEGTIAISGGTGIYSNLVVTGLPSGLSASLTDNVVTISGTPTAAGTFKVVSVAVTDSAGAIVKGTFTITIHAALSLGNLSKTAWTVNQTNYSGSIAIADGTGPFTAANVTVTGLPTGLTFGVSGTTITFSGTPTETGVSTIEVSVTDAAGATGGGTYTLTVNSGPIQTWLTGATAWTQNRAYTATIGLSDGTGVYSKLTVTGLPLGLTAALSGSTITISGKATQTGTFANLTVSAQDSSGSKAIATYSLTINPTPTLSYLSKAGWTVDQLDYQGNITIVGGTSAFTNLTATGLPTGLSAALTDNVITISGTPTQTGSFKSVVIAVTDSTGVKVTKTFTITINAAPALGGLSRASWTSNLTGYIGNIPITGGTGPFTVSAISGLPAGVTHSITGSTLTFSGKPTEAGVFTIDLDLVDSAGATVRGSYTLTINTGVALSALSKTAWTVGKNMGTVINISGGTGAYSKLTFSGLPAGMSAILLGSQVKITGTPTQTGTFSAIKIGLQDALGARVSATYSLTINVTPKLATLSKTMWTVNQAGYTGTITFTGGTAPFSLTTVTGLPAGVTATMTGRVITLSGTPTQTGIFKTLTVTAIDAAGVKATAVYTLTIKNQPALGALSVTTWQVNKTGYVGTIPIGGGTGPFTLASSSGLPTGLTITLSGTSIKIAGKPTQSGDFTIALQVLDSTGAQVDKEFDLTITA